MKQRLTRSKSTGSKKAGSENCRPFSFLFCDEFKIKLALVFISTGKLNFNFISEAVSLAGALSFD
jgi:hypothetical protein